jgi:DNA-binding LytR/AlgR family response regulator
VIKIAICDDEVDITTKVESILLDYATLMKFRLEISIFYDASTLLEFMNDENYFDLIFLDIEMKELTGIEFGNKLRLDFSDDDTRIVYISWNQSHAMDLFRIRPYHFLIKPIESQIKTIEKILYDVNEDMKRDKVFFHFQFGKTYSKEHYENILYFQSENRIINMQLKDQVIAFYGKLDLVENEVQGNLFLRIHKSILINIKHAKRFDGKEVLMDNGQLLEISKKYRDSVNEFILKNWGN